jgi:hypothetical protein
MKMKPKKAKTAKSAPSRNKVFNHHYLRLIPWAMFLVAVFYLVSLKAFIQSYPDFFSVPHSNAESLLTIPSSAVTTSASNLESLVGTDTNLDTSILEKNTVTAPAINVVKDTTTTIIDNTKNATSSAGSAAISADSNKTGYTSGDTEKVTNISPNLKFLSPIAGSIMKEKLTISASVENAEEVEFYLVKTGSLTKQHICTAKNKEANKWTCEINTRNIPNGEYKLAAKISNTFGNYNSSSIAVKVYNIEIPPVASRTSISEKPSSNQTENRSTSASEMENVKETVEKRSQEQNATVAESGRFAVQNATVAGALPQNLDSDQDGISNEEEIRIGTDPDSADTDKDGYMDGDEIRKGFNPLKSSVGDTDKIAFESPKEKGEVKNELISIESIEMVVKESEESGGSLTGADKEIRLKGKGLPYSFVTIYIYSETPTIVTVMTDENGNWNYSMDKDLENGIHEAYVAITDNEGHITAKSDQFTFVKTAQAATKASEEDIAVHNALATQSAVASSRTKRMAALAVLVLISLFTVIASIGLYIVYHYHHSKNQQIVKKNYLITK